MGIKHVIELDMTSASQPRGPWLPPSELRLTTIALDTESINLPTSIEGGGRTSISSRTANIVHQHQFRWISLKTRSALVGATSATLLILLLGSNVAIAAERHSLTLTYFGAMVDIGSQRYNSSGGSLVSASVTAGGKTFSLNSAHLEYSIEAKVQGNNVAGHATLQLKGHDSKSGEDAKSDEGTKSGQFSLAGRFDLTGMVPAVGFPLDPTQPDNPLHRMDNVVLTPHSASVSDWSEVERRRRVGQEIAAVLQGRMPRNVVNKEVLQKVKLSERVLA